jgi:hypothetical protein
MRLIKPTVTGQLVYQPELRFTSAGFAVCTFRLMQENGEEIVCEIWKVAAEDFVEKHFDDWQDKTFTITGEERIREYNSSRTGGMIKYPYRNVKKWEVK